MTEQEKINAEVHEKLLVHDEKFNSVMTKIDEKFNSFVREMADFKREMQDFKQEMRDRDNQRHAEIAEIRQSFQNMQNILMEMQTNNRHQNVLVIIGVAAMVVAVVLK